MKYTIRTEYPLSGDAVVIKYDNGDNIAEIKGEEYDAVRLAPYFQKGKSLNDLKEKIILCGKDENGVNAAYLFYRHQNQSNFSLYQFISILEKESILKRQKLLSITL